MGIIIASDTRTDHKKVAHELHTKLRVRNNFGRHGCTGGSCFDPNELWVMGPPYGLKVGRALIARHVKA